ncbi:hypothetical protein QM996_30625 (plasmid) [Sinorhizobium chiapasense]
MAQETDLSDEDRQELHRLAAVAAAHRGHYTFHRRSYAHDFIQTGAAPMLNTR